MSIGIVIGCARNEEPQIQIGQSVIDKIPDQELFDAMVRYDKAGQSRFTLQAARIARFDGLAEIKMDGGIQVDFFDKDGSHTAVLTALKGELLEREDQMIARENVIVRSDSGFVLRTEYLFYDQQIERVMSDSFVTIITPHDSLSGHGFNASPNLNDWTIENPSGTTWRRPQRRQRERNQ
ncbi:MAG: LPS export ABC transporter periplasmic protein LptC [Candidatus Electryoneaceae bacterium]|nr:LPS export ABC transporter periplasmic protein LptC [Candidatus Electryoneaceae bacterium]